MRISCDKNDLDYCQDHHMYSQYIVYLDGKIIDNCITADEEQCYVITCVLDMGNNIAINENGEILKRKYYGNIEIRK